MGIGLIVVEKQLAGELWSNTYGFRVGPDSGAPLTETDIQAIGFEVPVLATNTDPNDTVNYRGDDFLIHSIIGFERLFHYTGVEYVRIYITDGKKNPLPLNSVFATIDVNFNGLRAFSTGVSSAPGTITLQVNRVPAGIGIIRGRLFYRAVLRDEDIAFGSTRTVDFRDTTTRTTYENLIANSVVSSGLVNYLNTGTPPDPCLAIPRYGPDGTPEADQLISVNDVGSLVVRNVVSRQVKRGRRRSTT